MMRAPLRVLIVEDSPDDAELVVRALRRGGYDPSCERVYTRETMKAALEGRPWDVVISDYSMPGFDGPAALTLLQEKGLDLPFILVSGTVGEETAVAAMKAGAHDYLMKDNLARLAPAVERELREAEVRRQRRQEERKFRDLLESAPDAMVIVNNEGEIVLVNRQSEKLFGYRREDLVGKPVETLVPERLREHLLRYQSGSFVAPEFHPIGVELEVLGLRKDGTEFPAEVSLSPLEVADGMLFSSAIRDISERKHAEEKLRDALRRAEESDRLKSAFLANMSHEIRTPLNVILGFSALIGERLAELGDETHRELLPRIEQSGRRLLTTIHQVLDYSRISTGNFQVQRSGLRLHTITEGLVAEYRELAREKGLTLSSSDEAPGAVVSADQHCLTTAMRNLLDNAVKFTDRGEVSVRLYRDAQEGVYFSVRDTGVGIDPEYASRLFEPFSQEEVGYTRPFEGTGLGLALAKKYLELNGASLSVESTKGVGSIFTIRLPEAIFDAEVTDSEPTAPCRITPGEPARRATVRATVLVIEDDRETQAYMKEVLGARYEVLLAASARKARRHLCEHREEIGVILMDLSLKGAENGLMLARELRASETWRSIPIVAVTAHAFLEDERNALAAGCDRYLAKPVDPKTLLSAVEEALKGRDRLNNVRP
ncbi:MAG: response regulator [Candidatus Binatia bacterium]